MQAVAKGNITSLAGQQMMTMLELQRRAIESDEFAQRLGKVEDYIDEQRAA
jgi:hypothetical protein